MIALAGPTDLAVLTVYITAAVYGGWRVIRPRRTRNVLDALGRIYQKGVNR